MAKKKYNKTRFDIKQMTKQEGYTIINNLLFKYQEELGLDFTDLGILCKICAFSPDFSINFSKHFASMPKRTRIRRLDNLVEKGYITTQRHNFKTNEGTITGGLYVSIEPLVSILNELNENQGAKKDTLLNEQGAKKDTLLKKQGAKKDTLPPEQGAKKDTSNNTNKYYTNKEKEENPLQDVSLFQEQEETTDEEMIEALEAIEFRSGITEEEKEKLHSIQTYFKKKAFETMKGTEAYNTYRSYYIKSLPFWSVGKKEEHYTVEDAEAERRYNKVKQIKSMEPYKDNLWIFYGEESEYLVTEDDMEAMAKALGF